MKPRNYGTNLRMANWNEPRIVRNAKRAKYLRDRGDYIKWDMELKAWTWIPYYGYEDKFHCPNCHSDTHYFGTMQKEKNGPKFGYCHGERYTFGGCKFEWPRSDDHLYFKPVRRRAFHFLHSALRKQSKAAKKKLEAA